MGTLPEDEKAAFQKTKGKRLKGKKDNSGKLLEEYFMQAIVRQKGIVDKYLEIMNNEDIVMWGLAVETEDQKWIELKICGNQYSVIQNDKHENCQETCKMYGGYGMAKSQSCFC